MSDADPARTVLLSVAILVGMVPLAGCAELSQSPDQADDGSAASSEAEATASVEEHWIQLTLLEGPDAPYPREEIHLRSVGPEGEESHEVCAGPSGSEDGCDGDLGEGWAVGQTLRTPCLSDGVHRLEVHVLGVEAFTGSVVCEDGAPSSEGEPERAMATAQRVDLDDDGDVEWIRLVLTQGERAPYEEANVTITSSGHEGQELNVCEHAEAAEDTPNTCADPWGDGAGDTDWNVGENLWIPCEGEGNHVVTASVQGTTILDLSVECDEDDP